MRLSQVVEHVLAGESEPPVGVRFWCHQTPFRSRCQLPSELPNATYELPISILNESYPYEAALERYSSCSLLENGRDAPCDSYIYDYSKYESSIVIEVIHEL
uniref:Uncharacterized protein n=1 Tax=Photinus pyralis TaxID=7054 RepID=A0A1Y1M2J1_PHOPY